MKTTIELPDPLFRQAKILAARRGTTLRELVVEGLQHVTATGSAPAGAAPRLTTEKARVATLGAHGLPVLKRPAKAKRKKVTRALVDRLRDAFPLSRAPARCQRAGRLVRCRPRVSRRSQRVVPADSARRLGHVSSDRKRSRADCRTSRLSRRIGFSREDAPIAAGLRGTPGHVFWADEISICDATGYPSLARTTAASLTDLYLLALALHHGANFATFDHRIDPTVLPGGSTALVQIPIA